MGETGKFMWKTMILFVISFGFTLVLKSFSKGQIFDQYQFDIKKANDIEQRLSDVKGIDEIKEEIDNVIKMVKNPSKYHESGAKLHKGVLLFGKPGTGKTLIARAIAGEA